MIFPAWLLGLLFVGGAVGFSVGGLALVRRFASPATLREHHDVAGFILAIVGVIYVVLLAFVVLVVWERHNEAEAVAQREANALVDIYRLTPGLAPSARQSLRADVRLYGQNVVKKEWPLMARGQNDDSTSHAVDALWRTCTRVRVTTNSEAVLLEQLLDRLTDVGDNRRLRLLASRSGVPRAIWMVLLVGALATVGFTFYFGLERFAVQAGMTAILAGTMALVLFLIAALDLPFRGDLSVPPEAMKAALERCDVIDEHEKGHP